MVFHSACYFDLQAFDFPFIKLVFLTLVYFSCTSLPAPYVLCISYLSTLLQLFCLYYITLSAFSNFFNIPSAVSSCFLESLLYTSLYFPSPSKNLYSTFFSSLLCSFFLAPLLPTCGNNRGSQNSRLHPKIRQGTLHLFPRTLCFASTST